MAGNLDMALESLDVPPELHDSMVEKFSQQSDPPQPPAAQGSEPPAPDANSATNAAPQANNTVTPSETKDEQATQEENTQEAEDVIEIDPNKKIKIGDEVLTWSQLQYRSAKKADLDKEKFQLNKERELLDLEKQDAANAKYWKQRMESDEYARQYMSLIDGGTPPAEARAIAAKIVGDPLPVTPTAPAQTQNNSAIDPSELTARLPKLPATIEPNSAEHAAWYESTYRPAEMALVAQLSAEKVAQQIEATRAAEQKQARDAEMQKQQEQMRQKAIVDANQEQLNAIPGLLWTYYGIEPAKLTPEQRQDATDRLSTVLQENGMDVDNPQWMSSNMINPLQIKGIVREAFSEGKNPYVHTQKSPVTLERPKGNITPPLSADRTSPPAATPTNGAERFSSAMEAALSGLDDKK